MRVEEETPGFCRSVLEKMRLKADDELKIKKRTVTAPSGAALVEDR